MQPDDEAVTPLLGGSIPGPAIVVDRPARETILGMHPIEADHFPDVPLIGRVDANVRRPRRPERLGLDGHFLDVDKRDRVPVPGEVERLVDQVVAEGDARRDRGEERVIRGIVVIELFDDFFP
jgi:hypothetical protein